jgi:hypothetical protein
MKTLGASMYFELGTPLKLDSINKQRIPHQKLKDAFEILIIDDRTPPNLETLRNCGFRVKHIKDLELMEIVEPFPIIACDINGIGKKFRPDSTRGGIHVLTEIRKHYPDKYLIQYSTQDQSLYRSFTKPDLIFPKDTTIEGWQQTIESALQELGNPKTRWMRVRNRISDEGVDAYEIFKIEQAYIKTILNKSESSLTSPGLLKNLNPVVMGIIKNFASTTLAMGITELIS